MHPSGSAALGGAQVLRIGTKATVPSGFVVRSVPPARRRERGGEAERVLRREHGRDPAAGDRRRRRRGALAADARAGPCRRERRAPPAGHGAALAPAGEALLRSLHHPAIYVMNAAHVSAATLGALARLGRVTKIPESEGSEASTATGAPIAAARFTDGTFGWGVKEPGHGLVFATLLAPLDAPAAALLSATGDYGPLLLLETAQAIPAPLAAT